MNNTLQDSDEAYQFYRLASKFARHYHEEPPQRYKAKDCLACDAIQLIENGQSDVANMLSGRAGIYIGPNDIHARIEEDMKEIGN